MPIALRLFNYGHERHTPSAVKVDLRQKHVSSRAQSMLLVDWPDGTDVCGARNGEFETLYGTI